MSEAKVSTAPPTQPRKRVVRRKKKQLTPKQKLVKESAEQRFKIEKLVFVWQEKLFSQAKVTPHTLQRASLYMQPKTFEEVIEERVVQTWCGYPLCDRVPKTQELQKYKISLTHRKVYDQSELANYCSESCYHKGKYYILQLSEEPVWFRDLNALPTTHVILLEEDFKTAIQQEKKRTLQLKTNEDLRQDYVQHLLANVPKDTKEKFQIIEKTTVAPPLAITNESSVYDSIEGYRIEIKKQGRTPTTMVLKKKSQQELKKEQEEKKLKEEKEKEPEMLDPDDPDALFETMMMLKDMNMDKEVPKKPIKEDKEAPQKPIKEDKEAPQKPTKEDKEVPQKLIKEEPVVTKPAAEKQLTEEMTIAENKPVKEEKKVTFEAKEDSKDTKVAEQKPKKAANKKKKAVPELSLFGTIWTILDHMTTKATRIYLSELQTNHQRVDISSLLTADHVMDDSVYLRGQIFSERILETYGIIRTQLDIQENFEDDIVNVIKTFRLSDASMVALNPAQCYMMTLVIIKSLADILLYHSNWKPQFEACCNTIDQSTDTVDACVRVLKIASV